MKMNLTGGMDIIEPGESSMWRFFPLLPLENPRWIVSQGEGGTPLIEAESLASHLGVRTLMLKNETLNPTGAFKDRQVSFGISKALEAGAESIATVSSGNVAASAASYAARAGMTCRVFTPSNAPDARLVQARIYGAEFYKVNTLSSSRIFQLVSAACRKHGWHLLSTAGLYNPFQVEGAKTIAYELFEQAPNMPDWVIVPVGGGGLLGAVWRGLNELAALGKIRRIPRLAGVQATACTPLVKAIKEGLTPGEVIENPVEVGRTIAGAIADDILFDAYTALPAIRETKGAAVAVSDEEMMTAQRHLAGKAGLFAEPASAATLAGLSRLLDNGTIGRKETVCCVMTGSGFKDMDAAGKNVGPTRTIEPTEEAFNALGHVS